MIGLEDGMLLYHGSYVSIPDIDLSRCIEKLLPNRLKDQFCFRTQDAVEHLEFIRSDRYGDIKL